MKNPQTNYVPDFKKKRKITHTHPNIYISGEIDMKAALIIAPLHIVSYGCTDKWLQVQEA